MRSHTTKDANPFGPVKGARAGANPFGSGAAGGGGGGNPFGAWADLGPEAEDESVEQIQGRIDGHAARIEESQRRMLQKAAEARQIGASTLEELHSQGEQLRQVGRAQDQVDANLATSDRLLRGMESWRGAFVNAVGGLFTDILNASRV